MMKFALALLFGSAIAGFTAPASAQTPAAKPMPAAAPAMKPAAAAGGPAPVAAPPPPVAPASPAAPQGPEMAKVGPMSRKVSKEDKKGVSDVYKSWEEGWKKGDGNALADLADFPIIMMSDNSKGEEKHFEATREQFLGIMAGMGNMPKDLKMSSKHTPTFISDSLVVAIGDMKMTMGKVKGSWHGFDVLTLKDGKWKFKQICEAGWGDMVPGEHGMAGPGGDHAMAPKPTPMMAPAAHPMAPAAAPAKK